MSNKELIHFKIGLSSNSDQKKPRFQIRLNDDVKVESLLTADANSVQFFKFDAELVEGEYLLKIDFLNKQPADTELNESGEIVKDLLLNIVSIEIDEIDIDSLIYTKSFYNPIYPDSYLDQEQKKITTVHNCVNLGWNGTWNLPFSSPVYIWLLENI
jgi:hypothetical protein